MSPTSWLSPNASDHSIARIVHREPSRATQGGGILMARTLPRLTRGGAGSYDRRHIREEDTMAIKVLELHHHGIRVGPTEADADRARTFYQDVLGLSPDPGRPYIPTI